MTSTMHNVSEPARMPGLLIDTRIFSKQEGYLFTYLGRKYQIITKPFIDSEFQYVAKQLSADPALPAYLTVTDDWFYDKSTLYEAGLI